MPEFSAAEGVGARAKPTRVSSENRYPNYDLMSCVALAQKVKDEGGNRCTVEQLGALLGYRNTRGGGFATRVANAKQFGLIETVQGRYKTTPRAETILYPATPEERQEALVEAFLNVPLYRRIYEIHKGIRLPESLGMQNLLHREFLISAGERAVLAERVMMDSADQAGFFEATAGKRTHLTIPIISLSPSVTSVDTEDAPRSEDARSGGGGGGANLPPGVHPALVGLLTLLPSKPGAWAGRTGFDEAWKGTLDVLYPSGSSTANAVREDLEPKK